MKDSSNIISRYARLASRYAQFALSDYYLAVLFSRGSRRLAGHQMLSEGFTTGQGKLAR